MESYEYMVRRQSKRSLSNKKPLHKNAQEFKRVAAMAKGGDSSNAAARQHAFAMSTDVDSSEVVGTAKRQREVASAVQPGPKHVIIIRAKRVPHCYIQEKKN